MGSTVRSFSLHVIQILLPNVLDRYIPSIHLESFSKIRLKKIIFLKNESFVLSSDVQSTPLGLVKYDYEGNGSSPHGLKVPQLIIIVWRLLITSFSLAKYEWSRDIPPRKKYLAGHVLHRIKI